MRDARFARTSGVGGVRGAKVAVLLLLAGCSAARGGSNGGEANAPGEADGGAAVDAGQVSPAADGSLSPPDASDAVSDGALPGPGSDAAAPACVDAGGIHCSVLAQDCPPGDKCVYQQLPADAGGGLVEACECAGSADPGAICTPSVSGDECAAGSVCDPSGVCSSYCLAASDCPAGESCVGPSEGVGVCRSGCAVGGSGCAAGMACKPVATTAAGFTGECMAGGKAVTGAPCEGDADCVAGDECSDSICVPACDPSKPACAAGEACVPVANSLPAYGLCTCKSSAECGANRACVLGNICESVCAPGGACGAGLGCKVGLTIASASVLTCQPPGGVPLHGPCANLVGGIDDCTSNTVCVYNSPYVTGTPICEQLCASGATCPGGQACAVGITSTAGACP